MHNRLKRKENPGHEWGKEPPHLNIGTGSWMKPASVAETVGKVKIIVTINIIITFIILCNSLNFLFLS